MSHHDKTIEKGTQKGKNDLILLMETSWPSFGAVTYTFCDLNQTELRHVTLFEQQLKK